MSKLTREDILSMIENDYGWYDYGDKCDCIDIANSIFDQHEDETAQLRMENDDLQKHIHELEELLKNSRARNGRKTTELKNLQAQLDVSHETLNFIYESGCSMQPETEQKLLSALGITKESR